MCLTSKLSPLAPITSLPNLSRPASPRFEVQRLSWQGKLGNLVLLPVRATGASAVASADYEKKAEFIRQVGPGLRVWGLGFTLPPTRQVGPGGAGRWDVP